MEKKWVYWLEELGQEHNELVGRKSANLGEMARIGLPVPPGFALSMDAYEKFLSETTAKREIEEYLAKSNGSSGDLRQLQETSDTLRRIVESKPIPEEMAEMILSHYRQLCDRLGICDVAVSTRSAGAVSRPGQYESYLNVKGESDLLEKIKKVWSSSFNLRSLSSQLREGGLLAGNPISVCVLKMVNARAAGVAFTAHPNTGDASKIIVEANWGLGESVVSGETSPDRFVLEKDSLRMHEKKLGQKTKRVTFAATGTCEEELPEEKTSAFCLSDQEVMGIGRLGVILESHFSNTPQDLEWALDDDLESPGNIVLLQTRPAKVAKKRDATDQILDHMLSCLYHR